MSNSNNDNLILTIGEIKEIFEGHEDLSYNAEERMTDELEAEAQKLSCDKERIAEVIAGLSKYRKKIRRIKK